MGKALLFFVAAAALGGSVAVHQTNQTGVRGHERVAVVQERYLAREAATSAFNVGASDVKDSFGGRPARLGVESATGTHGAYDLLVVERPADATVDVVATGRYGGEAHRVRGTFVQRFPLTSPLVLDVEDGVVIDATFGGSDFDVVGHDNRPATSTGGALVRGLGLSQHAVLTRTEGARAAVLGAMTDEQRARVNGKGAGADVVAADVTNLLDEIYEEALGKVAFASPGGQVTLPAGAAGSPTSPTIVRVSGDLAAGGGASGHGVLIADGDLTMEDDFRWEGLVFVTKEGSVRVTQRDEARVYGALVVRNTTTSATSTSSGTVVEQGEDRGCNAHTTAEYVSGGVGVEVTSSKALSNVVLDFGDGEHQRFEGLRATSGTFRGTGAYEGRWIRGAWVKSGCATSGDGPGYGLYHSNPDEVSSTATAPTVLTLDVHGRAGVYYSEEALGRLGRILASVRPTVSLVGIRTTDPNMPVETRESLGLTAGASQ